jgi:hypothetical protein
MSQAKSTQVAFLVNHVRGRHVGKQAVVVSVSGHVFYLEPRTLQKRFRFYDKGFSIFLEPMQHIKISIGIISPDSVHRGFLHCIAQYFVRPRMRPELHEVTLSPIGKVYRISMTVFVAPSYLYHPAPRPSDEDQSSSDV